MHNKAPLGRQGSVLSSFSDSELDEKRDSSSFSCLHESKGDEDEHDTLSSENKEGEHNEESHKDGLESPSSGHVSHRESSGHEAKGWYCPKYDDTQHSEPGLPLERSDLSNRRREKEFTSSSSSSSPSSSLYASPPYPRPAVGPYLKRPDTLEPWKNRETCTSFIKKLDHPSGDFSTDMEETRCKLLKVQQRFAESSLVKVSQGDDPSPLSTTPHSDSLHSATHEAKDLQLSCLSMNSEALQNTSSKDHDVVLKELFNKLEEAEEKIVELETDKDFLLRECHQLKTRLSSTSAREEQLQAFVTEAKIVALRDRQALEARHRDSIVELRRILHDNVSKVEYLEQQLRSTRSKRLQPQEDEASQPTGRNAVESLLPKTETSLHLHTRHKEQSQFSDESLYWKNECAKHMKLREKEEMEFCQQAEDQRRFIFDLKSQLDNSHQELQRFANEIKKERSKMETFLNEHDVVIKTYEETIATLKEKIKNLHLDCHNFQKIIRRKDQEHSTRIEREVQTQYKKMRYYEARWEKTCVAWKRRYQCLLEKYKKLLNVYRRSLSPGHLKHYIKSEISRTVLETMISQPTHALLQKPDICASSCYENTSGNTMKHTSTTFVLGTAIAPDSKVQSLPSASHDLACKIYQVLSPAETTGHSHRSHPSSEGNTEEGGSPLSERSHHTVDSGHRLEEQKYSTCPRRDAFSLRYY